MLKARALALLFWGPLAVMGVILALPVIVVLLIVDGPGRVWASIRARPPSCGLAPDATRPRS